VLTLALRNLKFRPGRHLITALSMFLAIGLMTFSIAIRLHLGGLYSLFDREREMMVMSRVPGASLPLGLERKVSELPGVDSVIHHQLVSQASSSDDRKLSFPLHAITEGYIRDDWFYVEPAVLEQWRNERTGAIVARATAEQLKVKPGMPLTVNTMKGPLQVKVVGISPKGFKTTGVIVHYDYMAETFNLQGRVSVIGVRIAPGTSYEDAIRTIDDGFRSSDAPTRSVPTSAFIEGVSRTMQVIPNLLGAAGFIILLVTFLVTANTIAISVRERTAEIATLRAIGYTRGRILSLIVLEAVIVCGAGGLLGGGVPVLLFRNGLEVGGQMFGIVTVGPDALAWALVVAGGLALTASIVPAMLAARIPVAQALREGA
jgi:putative ABC transport system permease protein